MLGSALLNTPIDSSLNRVLNCEEGGLWGFPTSWPRETWQPSASGKGSYYMQAYADVTIPAPLDLKPQLLLKVGLGA
jgi:hypothetical protein